MTEERYPYVVKAPPPPKNAEERDELRLKARIEWEIERRKSIAEAIERGGGITDPDLESRKLLPKRLGDGELERILGRGQFANTKRKKNWELYI